MLTDHIIPKMIFSHIALQIPFEMTFKTRFYMQEWRFNYEYH